MVCSAIDALRGKSLRSVLFLSQLYEDNPGALVRDCELLQPYNQVNDGATPRATVAPTPREDIKASGAHQGGQFSGSTGPLELDSASSAALTSAPAVDSLREASLTSLEAPATRLAVSAHASDTEPAVQTGAPHGDDSAPDALPIRRLQFASLNSDAVGGALAADQQHSPVAGQGGDAAGRSLTQRHAAQQTGRQADKPKGRRLWGVWSLLRRGKHAEDEQAPPVPGAAIGPAVDTSAIETSVLGRERTAAAAVLEHRPATPAAKGQPEEKACPAPLEPAGAMPEPAALLESAPGTPVRAYR